jgi:hypothetical protein
VAWESAHVVAWESARVEAKGSAHVEAKGSAHVVARGSAHVVAWGLAHVVAWESAHVVAWGLAHVVAWGLAHVVAKDFVSVVKREKTVKIKKSKRVVVIVPNYPAHIKDWSRLKGIGILKGRILLWKTVKKDGTDFHTGKISYINTAVAPDWNPSAKIECGEGLHLADSPSGARYFVLLKEEFRLIQVSAKITHCVCFPGNPSYPMKIRAKECKFVKEFPPDYNED